MTENVREFLFMKNSENQKKMSSQPQKKQKREDHIQSIFESYDAIFDACACNELHHNFQK